MIRYMSFIIWEQNLYEKGFKSLVTAAKENGHYHNLTEDEIKIFETNIVIPQVTISNCLGHIEEEGMDFIRVYGDVDGVSGILVGGKTCTATVRQEFKLQDFPFDLQELQIDFRIASNASLRNYYLIIDVIQFPRQSLQFNEWVLHTPLVKPSPVMFMSHAILQIERRPQFYINNVVGMMSLLACTGTDGLHRRSN